MPKVGVLEHTQS